MGAIDDPEAVVDPQLRYEYVKLKTNLNCKESNIGAQIMTSCTTWEMNLSVPPGCWYHREGCCQTMRLPPVMYSCY
jgi:hypothetical protein